MISFDVIRWEYILHNALEPPSHCTDIHKTWSTGRMYVGGAAGRGVHGS